MSFTTAFLSLGDRLVLQCLDPILVVFKIGKIDTDILRLFYSKTVWPKP